MIRQFLSVLFCTLIASTANAGPLLYTYEGPAYAGLAAVPTIEALLGRKLDGVVDFIDWQTPTESLGAFNYDVGAWKGHGYRLAVGVPLAFNSGGTLAQVAAGVDDSYYKTVAQTFSTFGEPVDIRLGWEMNGNWYPWGSGGATFIAAWNHVYPILKANCPTCTVIWNPSTFSDPTSEFPVTADGGSRDFYAGSRPSSGITVEPTMFNDGWAGWWGASSMITMSTAGSNLPSYAVSEFGVGSAADGSGACSSVGMNDCDDPIFMSDFLLKAVQFNFRYIGYWDYDQGTAGSDYNSKISDGSRPQEALVFLKQFGSPNQITIFTRYATTFTNEVRLPVTCTGCTAVSYQNGPSHWEITVIPTKSGTSVTVSWPGKTLSASRYDPVTSSNIIQSLGLVSSWTGVLSDNQDIAVAQ